MIIFLLLFKILDFIFNLLKIITIKYFILLTIDLLIIIIIIINFFFTVALNANFNLYLFIY